MRRGFSLLIFLLILGLPVIALNFGGSEITSLITERATAPTPQAPAIAEEAEPDDPVQWLSDRPALRDVFIPDELTPARYVEIETLVPLADLLAAGEAQPDESLQELYAAARAPTQLMPYCADILATIGTVCDVVYADAHETRDGRWMMDGRLAFVPSGDLGAPETTENGELMRTTALLPFTGDLRPPNEAATRIDMLQQAQSICDALRNRLGNCVVTQVTFDLHELWITDLEALPANTNPQRIEATAAFTVYADSAQFDTTSFADMVAALAEQS
ncbi:hypothetical protein BC777_3188 [Yoonia maricola]|uniref:Uncharacterized protein n=1 Tax=Yoonia maricola TaxID=420999 RepID=A0A2M8W2P6_9RHOB|nr:hypothetical protein [Yoonia maricola]PJI85189.1 hypothetical protein BC777_3188 [Yoonia maricola]